MSVTIRQADATGNTFILVYGIEPDLIDYRKILSAHSLDSALFIKPVKTVKNRRYFNMRVFEKDGSESQFCGNGSRALARFFYEKYEEMGQFFLIASGKLITLSKTDKGYGYTCPLPQLENPTPLIIETLAFYFLKVLEEPHLITFTPLTDQELTGVGVRLNGSSLFPSGVNVNSVSIKNPALLENKTYERGVRAITKACGSGSLAAFTVSNYLSFIRDEATVLTKGGSLEICKSREGFVTTTGSAIIYY